MKQIPVKNKGRIVFALIDDCDYDLVAPRKWSLASHGYPNNNILLSSGKRSVVLMHRLIMNAQKGQEVDHKDHNRLNNQRDNLRVCTRGQNACNICAYDGYTSRFKGVRLEKPSQRWIAEFKLKGKSYRIGSFVEEEDAARHYDAYASKYHGEFAILNFGTPDFDANIADIQKDTKKRHGCQSLFRGVARSRNGRWRASCQSNKKHIYIGEYKTEQEAAKAYDNKVKELGLNRHINFP